MSQTIVLTDVASANGTPIPTPNSSFPVSSREADALILFYADLLNDTEALRIATENRRRSLLSSEDWGKGVSPFLPEVSIVDGFLEHILALERGLEKELRHAMKAHPLGPWVSRTVGVGEKQAARLLALIGDPAWHLRDNRPRSVSELWAYCGLHVLAADGKTDHVDIVPHSRHVGIAPHRQRGQQNNWSGQARSRVFLIAGSCIKQQHSPYRRVYDEGRIKYADAVHQVDCARCKGASGTPLNKGHQHARAMRLVMKAILKDLWVEASCNPPTHRAHASTHEVSA